MENFYPMITAAVLLCCFLIYKEWNRENRSRRLLRILAIVLLTASLLFLILPITTTSTKTSDTKKLLLLSPGFTNQVQSQESYYTLDSSVLEALGPKRVKYLPDLAYYLRAHPEVTGLRVFGGGLNNDDLLKIGDLSYEFEPAPDAGGIISVSWPHIIPASSALNVQGVYDNKADQAVRLILEGAGSRFDSVTIAKNQKASFNLTSRPKQLGKAIYHLQVKQGEQVLQTEKVPFQIVETPKVKVLVLAASPDFEYKFLRNWFFESKIPAYFRTRISKDKFSIDAVNMAGTKATAFSASMFKDFDLILADDEELAGLSPAAKGSLNTAVSNGAGLLVRVTENKLQSSFAKNFRVSAATDTITSTLVPVLSGEARKLKALPVSQPLFISTNPEQVGLVESLKGNILLSTKLYGQGKVSASTIGSTYNWALSGSKSDYAQYWSYVINKTARQTEQTLSWQVKPQFPSPEERTEIYFQTKLVKAIPGFTVNKEIESTQQHQLLPFYWQSTAWLNHPGWNNFKIEDKASEEFFVYGTKDWNSVKIAEITKKNKEFASKHRINTQNSEKRIDQVSEEVSRWWFFALFLISAGFLWFETKILQ
jgi:hypothetical protein